MNNNKQEDKIWLSIRLYFFLSSILSEHGRGYLLTRGRDEHPRLPEHLLKMVLGT